MSNTSGKPGAQVTIRRLEPSDAKEASLLSGELGYPIPDDILGQRLEQFAECDDHVIYAAYLECGRMVGWIDVAIVGHLVRGEYGEIGGLVVSERYRGFGIGAKLVHEGEQWIADRGSTKVVVRSNVVRQAAHDFYLRQNYQREKTSAVFTKNLR